MTSSNHAPGMSEAVKGRRRSGRAQRPLDGDPYRRPDKLAEPTVCPQCGAVYHRGRWSWDPAPREGAAEMLCQACHRINDDFPGGLVTLTGAFVAEHMEDLMLLANAQAKSETVEHPLNRIMSIVPTGADTLEIATTDIHLPGRIGKAVLRAYDGVLDEQFAEGEYFVRVRWHRD